MKRLEATCDETGVRAEIWDLNDLPDGWVEITLASADGKMEELHFSSYHAMSAWAERRHATTTALRQRRALDDVTIRRAGRAA